MGNEMRGDFLWQDGAPEWKFVLHRRGPSLPGIEKKVGELLSGWTLEHFSLLISLRGSYTEEQQLSRQKPSSVDRGNNLGMRVQVSHGASKRTNRVDGTYLVSWRTVDRMDSRGEADKAANQWGASGDTGNNNESISHTL